MMKLNSMKKLILVLLVVLVNFSFAQKEKVQLYIDIYKDIAIQEMQRSGVPAAITLAQGILESKFGESELSQKSNNHFGIKCKLDWAGEKVYQDDDTKQECFRKYTTPQESYKDHSDFLRSREHYAWLFKLDPTDYAAWAKGLKKSGYATEGDYPERLIELIERFNLNQYTLVSLSRNPLSASTVADNGVKLSNRKTTITTTVVADEPDEVEPTVKTVAKASNEATVNYPTSVFSINNTKVIYANAGTSTLALAELYNISLAKLFEMNDMDEVEILEKSALIYLERKQKKGTTDYHVVQANETLFDIAQKEGVRLDMILEYNGVSKKLNPVLGEKIYLRSKAPVTPKMSSAVAANPVNTNNNTIN